MSEAPLKDEIAHWETRALAGDYSAMQDSFGWVGSARFAHFLHGYDEAVGFDTHMITARRMIYGEVLKYQNGFLIREGYETPLPD